MPITVDTLRAEVGASTNDNDVLTRCLDFANVSIDTYTAGVVDGVIPQVVLDEALLAVAADQFHRRKAPNGVLNQTYGVANAGITPIHLPVRIGRDPLAPARPILSPWIGGLA